jgi:ankyrin repeat protein
MIRWTHLLALASLVQPTEALYFLLKKGYNGSTLPLIHAFETLPFKRKGKGWGESKFNREIISALISDPVAKLDAVTESGNCALGVAVDKGDLDFVREMLAAGARWDVPCDPPILHRAARSWTMDDRILASLRDAGMGLDQLNEDHENVLHEALALPTLRFLVEEGADPNQQDNRGFTPLMTTPVHFSPSQRKEAVNILVAGGADPNLQNEAGRTALLLALLYRQHLGRGPIEELLAIGADPNLADHEGVSPLDVASQNCPSLIPLLVEHGADPHRVHPELGHWSGRLNPAKADSQAILVWWSGQERQRLIEVLPAETTLSRPAAPRL